MNPADLSEPLGGGKEFFSQLSGKQADLLAHQADARQGRPVKREVLGQGMPVAPVNIGPSTNKIVYNTPKYDDAFMGKFIKPLGFNGNAGPRLRPARRTTASTSTSAASSTSRTSSAGTAQDGVAGYNCHAIALEIPTTTLTADGQAPEGRRERRATRSASGPRRAAVRSASSTAAAASRLRPVGAGLAPRPPAHQRGGHRPPGQGQVQPHEAREGRGQLRRVLPEPGHRPRRGGGRHLQGARRAAATRRLAQVRTASTSSTRSTSRPPGHDIPLSATGDVLRVDLASTRASRTVAPSRTARRRTRSRRT